MLKQSNLDNLLISQEFQLHLSFKCPRDSRKSALSSAGQYVVPCHIPLYILCFDRRRFTIHYPTPVRARHKVRVILSASSTAPKLRMIDIRTLVPSSQPTSPPRSTPPSQTMPARTSPRCSRSCSSTTLQRPVVTPATRTIVATTASGTARPPATDR